MLSIRFSAVWITGCRPCGAERQLGSEKRTRSTYLVEVAAQVEQQRLRKLAAVDGVVLTEVLAGDGGRVDVQSHLPVVSTSLEDVAAERDKVVERGQHFIKEVDSVGLEELVCELEDGPHVGRDGAKLEGQAVHKLVHVVQEVYQQQSAPAPRA